jgi:Cu+-exporting ATPase
MVKFAAKIQQMKKVLLAGIFGSILWMVACQSAPEVKEIKTTEESTATAPSGEVKTVALKVEGMKCAMGCAKFIENKIVQLPGVSEGSVHFESGLAEFHFDPAQINEEEIHRQINAIHDGQYQATIVEQKKAEPLQKEDAEETTSEGKANKSLHSVKQSILNSIPELLTYFMKRAYT